MSNGAAPPNATEQRPQPMCWADMSSDEEDAFATVLTDLSSTAQHRPPPPPLQKRQPSIDLAEHSQQHGRQNRNLPRRASGQRSGGGGQRPYTTQMSRSTHYGGGGGGPGGGGRDRRLHGGGGGGRTQGSRGAYTEATSSRPGTAHMTPSLPELPEQDLGPPYKVHVGSLPLDVTTDQIIEAFKPLKVLKVEIPHGSRSEHLSAYAFVQVADFGDQRRAIQNVNGTCIGSRPVVVGMPRQGSQGRRQEFAFRAGPRIMDSASRTGDDVSVGSHTLDSAPSVRPGTDGPLPPPSKHRFNLAALTAAVASTDESKRNASIFGTGRPREERVDMRTSAAEGPGATTSEEMSAGQQHQRPSQSAPVVDSHHRPSGAQNARQNSPRETGENPPEMVVTMPASYLASPKRTEIVDTQAAPPPPSNQSSSSSNRGRTERPSYASVLRAPQSPVVAPQAALTSTAPQQPRTRTGRGRAVAKSKQSIVVQKRAGRSDSDRTSDFESFAKPKHRV